MKRPYKWWKAIAPAAADVLFALLVAYGFIVLSPKVVSNLLAEARDRPIGAALVAFAWLLVGLWLVKALPARWRMLVGVLRLWKRQRARQTL